MARTCASNSRSRLPLPGLDAGRGPPPHQIQRGCSRYDTDTTLRFRARSHHRTRRRCAAQRHSRRTGYRRPLTLERIAAAARQQRRLGLPILVSGGLSEDHKATLAALMSQALEEDFGLSARWREERSRNTFENASFYAAILLHVGIASAFVVAHPWDMARTLWSFVAVGYPVVPMPVPEGRALPLSPSAFLPQVPALQDSYYALHELIGLAWYRLRYGDW
jgi:uncharacterized SAM-binding protein YcdF (DUF218 family)